MKEQFKFQKRMREHQNNARSRGLINVLDIGSSKISSALVQIGDAKSDRVTPKAGLFLPNLGCRVLGLYYTRSEGVEDGEVIDPVQTSNVIKKTLHHTFRIAGRRSNEVVISFSGLTHSSSIYTGSTELFGNQVTEKHIAKAILESKIPTSIEGREFIHAQPIHFAIDHRGGILDPRGQSGNKLTVSINAVTISTEALQCILEALVISKLNLAGLVSSAYASGLSTLVENELELGSVIVDIGHGVTKLAGFMKKHMLFTDSFNIGGQLITSDIVEAFGVSGGFAERLKILQGGVNATTRDDKILFDTPDEHRNALKITRSDLISVIRPRVEEILETISHSLEAFEWGIGGTQPIVFTGGGSLIAGFDDLVRSKFGQGVRIGRPVQLTGYPSEKAETPFSALVGLCILVVQPQDEVWDFDIIENQQKGIPWEKMEEIFPLFSSEWIQKSNIYLKNILH
ncbi:MAG: cell division protein FtsA [Rhodobacteraceae bacterium]|nr:cell division protein FtsA [Paracoccaceae bacterium]MCY4250359.1 cell division protein FtsA [Paracoccaceae bacterium]MCY4308491.1 cell division protein FtsA [Paracoccaceae bacterium]